MAKKKFIRNYRLTRQKLRLSQGAFWGRIGVTQSTGSRYEQGKTEIPVSVEILAHDVYINKNPIDAKDFQ